MINKFKEMFDLQNQLNNNTNGVDWKKGFTLQGRRINWYRCIYMEAAEAIDSLNWKHWKDIEKSDDLENLKIELVDIWHFIMSQAIVDFGLEKAIEKSYTSYDLIFNMHYNDTLTLTEILEKIIVTSANKELQFSLFFRAVKAIENFSMDDVYLLYLGKNCLNQFRQDNGYKDGLYIKIWNGEEDNVSIQQILDKNPNITYDKLYSSLAEKYKKIKKDK